MVERPRLVGHRVRLGACATSEVERKVLEHWRNLLMWSEGKTEAQINDEFKVTFGYVFNRTGNHRFEIWGTTGIAERINKAADEWDKAKDSYGGDLEGFMGSGV